MLYLQQHASFLWGDNEGSLDHRGRFSGHKRIPQTLLNAARESSIAAVAHGTTVVAIQTAVALQPYGCQYWMYQFYSPLGLFLMNELCLLQDPSNSVFMQQNSQENMDSRTRNHLDSCNRWCRQDTGSSCHNGQPSSSLQLGRGSPRGLGGKTRVGGGRLISPPLPSPWGC